MEWKCKCGFHANSEKMTNFLEKLEQEVTAIDAMEEQTETQMLMKVNSYQNFIDRKSKLLSATSHILLNIEANICSLLGQGKCETFRS